MWKHFYLVTLVLCVPVLSKFSNKNVIDKITARLGITLDYISRHHDKINIDCLFGVVLADAILDDSVSQAGPYREKAKGLKDKTREIFNKTVPLMEKLDHWNNFAKYLVAPGLWTKSMKYKAPILHACPKRSYVERLFSDKTYENYSEGFSDDCLSSVINSTLDLKPKNFCPMNEDCHKFMTKYQKGSGYMLTHKLLLLQVQKVRKCVMQPRRFDNLVKRLCGTIYTETISVDYFDDLEEIFDLFLEQILLCGYEGYSDFLKMKWLENILDTQFDTGCFPVGGHTRTKRETNEWKDGCADHTTGLGAAVLTLYFNYLTKEDIEPVVLAYERL